MPKYQTIGDAMQDPQSSLRKRLDAATAERREATKTWTQEDWARYVTNYRHPNHRP